jgi:triphosphatase
MVHRPAMTRRRGSAMERNEVPAHSLYRLARSSLLQAARKKSFKPATLVSVYFDTDKLKLRNKGLSLRVRRIGRRHIQTIKQESGESAALFTRNEWEHPVGGRQPDLDVARDAACAESDVERDLGN